MEAVSWCMSAGREQRGEAGGGREGPGIGTSAEADGRYAAPARLPGSRAAAQA